jgi:hypothetical protein
MLSSITKKGEIESTFAPLVVLVINVNMCISDKFNKGMARARRCGDPFKMLRTCIGKSSRLFIFGLVIQDHIESIGKPILLKGDEVLIMIYLLKCLVMFLQNPQPLPSSKSVQNPKSQHGPTKYFHPGPTEFSHTVPQPKP